MAGTIETVFGSTALDWLLQLLFFPSGVLTALLMLLMIKRTKYQIREDEKITKAARFQDDKSSLRRLRDEEIHYFCGQYRISHNELSVLRNEGKINAQSCGLCMGDGTGAYLQIPCGDYAHVRCMKNALQQDIATCADCGFSIKSVFDIKPEVDRTEL